MKNRKMDVHRKTLALRKDEYESEFRDVCELISMRGKDYRKKCNGIDDCSLRMKLFRDTFGDLHDKREWLIKEIEKLELELLEKKYANHYGYSDVEPYEVIEEITPNKYLIRWMKSAQTEESKKKLKESFVAGGFIGHVENDLQEWNISSCDETEAFAIRRHKDGNWYDSIHRKYVISPKPIKFYDYNF